MTKAKGKNSRTKSMHLAKKKLHYPDPDIFAFCLLPSAFCL
jgi:hypothetical protein